MHRITSAKKLKEWTQKREELFKKNKEAHNKSALKFLEPYFWESDWLLDLLQTAPTDFQELFKKCLVEGERLSGNKRKRMEAYCDAHNDKVEVFNSRLKEKRHIGQIRMRDANFDDYFKNKEKLDKNGKYKDGMERDTYYEHLMEASKKIRTNYSKAFPRKPGSESNAPFHGYSSGSEQLSALLAWNQNNNSSVDLAKAYHLLLNEIDRKAKYRECAECKKYFRVSITALKTQKWCPEGCGKRVKGRLKKRRQRKDPLKRAKGNLISKLGMRKKRSKALKPV